MCNIDNTDIKLFGEDGSSSIVILTKNKKAYKLFTLFNYVVLTDSNKKIEKANKNVENEIKIYKLLTKNIINKNISHHYVKYIRHTKCDNADKIFDICGSYTDHLNSNQESKKEICNIYYRSYKDTQLQP